MIFWELESAHTLLQPEKLVLESFLTLPTFTFFTVVVVWKWNKDVSREGGRWRCIMGCETAVGWDRRRRRWVSISWGTKASGGDDEEREESVQVFLWTWWDERHRPQQKGQSRATIASAALSSALQSGRDIWTPAMAARWHLRRGRTVGESCADARWADYGLISKWVFLIWKHNQRRFTSAAPWRQKFEL